MYIHKCDKCGKEHEYKIALSEFRCNYCNKVNEKRNLNKRCGVEMMESVIKMLEEKRINVCWHKSKLSEELEQLDDRKKKLKNRMNDLDRKETEIVRAIAKLKE